MNFLHGKNLIASQYSSLGKEKFQTVNPVTKEKSTGFFYEATFEEADLALQLANEAFLKLQKVSNIEKANFLNEIAEQIKQIPNLKSVYCFESGLSEKRFEIELTRTLNQLEIFADALKSEILQVKITSKEVNNLPEITKIYRGIGPIVVFGASNFPLAYSTAGGDTISAFAAACPVIVKAHPSHAGTSELIADAISKAALKTKMPEGIFSHLQSNNFELGSYLAKHPFVKGIGFTGSLKGGRAIFDIANQREVPIPVFAEMGSINPVIVYPSKQNDETAVLLSNSICNDAGQFCTKPGLIFVIKGKQTSTFIDKMKENVIASPSYFLLNQFITNKFKTSINELKIEYPTKLKQSNNTNSNDVNAAILQLTYQEFISKPQLIEEIFGPFSITIECENLTQIFARLQHINGSLTCSLFCEEDEIDDELMSIFSSIAGRVIFNGVPTGVAVVEAMTHGGPYPASTDNRFTAVGIESVKRWQRPISFQNFTKNINL